MSESDPAPKKKGGFLGGLKGMIFEEEDPSKAAPAETATDAGPPQPHPAAPQRPAAPVPAGAPDPKIREVLAKAVREAALPAYDAFEKVTSSLQGVLPDEGTRIKAALATLVTQGYDLDAVLKDVDECLEALTAKERDADAAAAKAIQDRVGSREKNCERIAADIAAKNEQIAQLQRDIGELRAEETTERAAIATERQDIDSTHARFTATVAAYRSELEQMKQKITRHGKGA